LNTGSFLKATLARIVCWSSFDIIVAAYSFATAGNLERRVLVSNFSNLSAG
jgi:hypothetical protein